MTSAVRVLALLLTVFSLPACSSDSKSPESPGVIIPTDIEFNEKALPAMTDQEVMLAKYIVKAAGLATGPENQLLIAIGETDEDRRERENEFQKLRPEVQNLVRELRITCQPNYKKSESGFDGKPAAGKSTISSETNALTGANCPVKMEENSHNRMVFTSFTENPLSFAANISAAGNLNSLYQNPQHQQVMGASQANLRFTMDGRFEQANSAISLYFRMGASGQMIMVRDNLGTIGLTMTTEALMKPELQKSVATYNVTQGGRTYVFTSFSEATAQKGESQRYFIGNRELTRQEVIEMDGFPFDLDETRKRIGNQLRYE